MDPLEKLLRPLTAVLNRNISETTPARELCRQLDGKTVAIRVRDTALAMYFDINDEVLTLRSGSDVDPHVILTGSLLTLARMAAPPKVLVSASATGFYGDRGDEILDEIRRVAVNKAPGAEDPRDEWIVRLEEKIKGVI